MTVYEVAAIVSEPQEYFGAVSEKIIENSEEAFGYEAEAAFSYDQWQLAEMGFDRRDLVVCTKKLHELGMRKRLLTSLAKVYTVNVPVKAAIENDYVPDAVMEEDGHITQDDGSCDWKDNYRRILGAYDGSYVLFMNVPC